ncbi:TPA: MerR family DNA-binding transcriptional regulator [Staphylococcus pseudintermedius]
MYTIKVVSELTGLSTRTLRYYDQIGLLNPSNSSETGYRLYSEKDIAQI